MEEHMETIVGPTWGSYAWRGVASIAFGAIALAWPAITLAGLAILFGAYALTDGVLAIGVASRRGDNPHRWLLLLDGVLGVGTGIVTLLWPGIGLLALIFVVAFRAITIGVLQIGASWQLRRAISAPWLYAFGGVVTVIFGITMLAMPGISAYVLVTMLGVYAIFFGVAFLGLAYATRRSSEHYLLEPRPV
jgi:uncharacterized membrane protein HdeD (DUF308 family)